MNAIRPLIFKIRFAKGELAMIKKVAADAGYEKIGPFIRDVVVSVCKQYVTEEDHTCL